MRIIAKMTDDKFLVEMTRNEIMALGSVSWSDRDVIRVGATLSAEANIEKIKDLHAKRGKALRAAKDLRSLADLLEAPLNAMKLEGDDA